MSDDAEIRRENLRRTGLRPAELVERAGRTFSFYSDLLRDGSTKAFGEKLARALEEQLHFPRGRLDQAPEPRNAGSRSGKARPRDQGDVPLLYEITVPPLVPWGWLVKAKATEIPRLFVVQMPDGALQGDVSEGDELVFDRDKAPSIGRPVLVETGDGVRFVRRYAEGRGGHWRALATTDAYLSFDSSTEDIRLLAALRWRT